MNTASKGILIPQGYPIIDEVVSIIEELNNPEHITVLTPTKRSMLYLAKKIAEKSQTPQIAPKMFSIEDFVNYMYEKYTPSPLPLITPLDAVFFIEEANKSVGLLNNPQLDNLLPWAFKLFSDFEELYIEGIPQEQLSQIDTLISEEGFPEYIRDKISRVSKLYKAFYEKASKQFSTRSTRYIEVSRLPKEVFKDVYIIFGFYALTKAEKDIFKKIIQNTKTFVIAHKDERTKEYMNTFGIEYEEKKYETKKPSYRIFKAAQFHDEVFALRKLIKEKNAHTIENVIVLPNQAHLFAVINNIDVKDKNISLGYPLIRTPLFSLLSFIEKLFIDRVDDKYLKTSYLNVILHPYIKNTRFKKSAVVTRILMHTIEEELKNMPTFYISLKDVENMDIIQKAIKKARFEENIEPSSLLEHLKNIHNIVINAFLNIENIGDFIDKTLALFDFVSTRTTANLHPYGGPFIETAIRSISNIKDSLLTKRRLNETRSYFNLLKNYVKTQRVPFKGTPLSGLQILGFLETRNLSPKRVFFLDVNEGIIPDVKKEDTILSDTLRRYLNLSTANDREKITRYYFFNLIKGADEVYLFYTKKDKEPSRYIEMLKWEEEEKAKKIDVLTEKEIVFPVSFSYQEPQAIQKTPDIINKLQDLTFSPTLLDTYLRCPLMFYFKYLVFPSEKEDEKRTKSNLDIGTILHNVLYDYFKKWRGKNLIIRDLEKEQQEIHAILDKHFGEATSNELLIQKIQVKHALDSLLDKHTRELKGIKILELEKTYKYNFRLNDQRVVKLKGKIDRVHEKDGKIYIIDYKSGSINNVPDKKKEPTWENRDNWHNIIKSFQLPIYTILYHENTKTPYDVIIAQLWSMRYIKKEKDYKKEFDMSDKKESYINALQDIISEILDPEEPFSPIKDRKEINNTCVFCPYKSLCDRLWAKKRY